MSQTINISSSQQDSEEDSLFRIMVSSDNHLGYVEHDQIRGDDSFQSFEEVLKVAKREKVDFLLLGGDLFHHHNPSKKTIIRASNILQQNVYGQKEHNYEVFCYDPNFKNENLSIELPIFIIHGNHDDPSGFENFSSIDIFSGCELNYFGKVSNYEEFSLYPILFIKGNTKIALYGLGNLKDERLFLALQNKKVDFNRPEDYSSWFNILIVHQNRFKGHHAGKNKKNFLPESFIPSFFDLVIWGHEHETFTEPVKNNEIGFHVYQPGSTVVTSLIAPEAKPKGMGLLEIHKEQFRIIPVKLETVRPFVYCNFDLKAHLEMNSTAEEIEKVLVEKIESMLSEVKENYPNNNLLPLLRMKIEVSDLGILKTNTILGKFSGRIANPSDVIQSYKKTAYLVSKSKLDSNDMDIDEKLTSVNADDDDLFQDQQDELRKHVGISLEKYLSERNKYGIYNTEFFRDSLDKTVLGQEKKSIEIFYKRFFETMIQKTKQDSSALKQLNPLEFIKKDFSAHFQELVNIEAFNYEFINKFKKKDDILNNQEEVDMLFDEKDEKSLNENNNKKKSSNANKNAAAGYKNNIRPNINSLSSFYANKLNINMNNSNVSNETLNNSRLLNTSANNMNSRNTLTNKNISVKEVSSGSSRNILAGAVKDRISDNINYKVKNEKSILEEIDFKRLEEEVDDDCCLEDDDFDGPHIKLNNQDSEMFVSEVPRNVNKKPLILNNINNNANANANNKFLDKNTIKIESDDNKEKNKIKVESSNQELEINKIRTAYNLVEKPANVLNKNGNNSQFNFDLNKKSNNVSILNFINKGVKKNNEIDFDIDSKSEMSDCFDMAPKNRLIKNNQNGKRKNISEDNDITKKNVKKKKPNFN